jgi:hypothetical protein
MDFPFLLLVLLLTPFATAAVILAVSTIRRRRRARAHGAATEPHHRAQADTGAVQDATVHPEAGPAKVRAARDRRAESVRGATDA